MPPTLDEGVVETTAPSAAPASAAPASAAPASTAPASTAPARKTLQPSTLPRRAALSHSNTHQWHPHNSLYDVRTRRKIKAIQDDSDDEPVSSSPTMKPAMAAPGALLASYAAEKCPYTSVDVWQGGSSPRMGSPSAPQTPSAAGSHDTSVPDDLPVVSQRSELGVLDIHTCSWVNVPNVVQKAIVGAHDKLGKVEDELRLFHKELDRIQQNMQKTQEWTVTQLEGSKQALGEAVRGMKGSKRNRRKQVANSFGKAKTESPSGKTLKEPSSRLGSKQRRTPVLDLDGRKLSSLRVRTSGQQLQFNKFSTSNDAACSSDSSSDASSDELDEVHLQQITNMQETLKTMQASMTTFTETLESDKIKTEAMESKLCEVAHNLDKDAIEANIKDHVWQSIVECLPKWLNWMGATDSADLESARAFFHEAKAGANRVKEEIAKEVQEVHDELLYRVEDLEREVQEFFVEEADDFGEEDETEMQPAKSRGTACSNRRATRFVNRRNSADPGLEALRKQHEDICGSQASSRRHSQEDMLPSKIDPLSALGIANWGASAPDSSVGNLPSQQEDEEEDSETSEAPQAILSEQENDKSEQGKDQESAAQGPSLQEKAESIIKEMKARRRSSVGADNEDLTAESAAKLVSVAQAVVTRTRQSSVVPQVSVVCHMEDAPPELVVPPRSDEALNSPGGLSVGITRNTQRGSGRTPSLRIATTFEDGRSRSRSPEGSVASSTRSFGRSESPGARSSVRAGSRERQQRGSKGLRRNSEGGHNDSRESLLSLNSSAKSSASGTPRGSLSRCSSNGSMYSFHRFDTDDAERSRSPSSSAQPRRSIINPGNRASRSTVKNKTVNFPVGSPSTSRRGSAEGEPGQSRARTKITHALLSMEDKAAQHERVIKKLKDYARHHGQLVRQHTKDFDKVNTILAENVERIEEKLKESTADAAAARFSIRQDLVQLSGQMTSFKEELDSVKDEVFTRLSSQISSHLETVIKNTVNQIEEECERINAQARIVFPRARKEDRASSFSASEARWYVLDSRLASCEEKLLNLPNHQGSCMSLLPPEEAPVGRRKNRDKFRSNPSQEPKGGAARLRSTICKELLGKSKGSPRSALGGNTGKDGANSFADEILAAATITVPEVPSRAASRRSTHTAPEMQQDVLGGVTFSNSDSEQEPQNRLQSRRNSLQSRRNSLEVPASPASPGGKAGGNAWDGRAAPEVALAPLRMKLPTHELRDEAKVAAAEVATEVPEVIHVSKATIAVDAAIAEAQKFLSNRRAEFAVEGQKGEVAPSTHRGELAPGSRKGDLELEGTPPPLSDVPIHSSGSSLPLVSGATAGTLYQCTEDTDDSLLSRKEVVNAIEDGLHGPVLMKPRHQDESHSTAKGSPRESPAATAAAVAAATRAAVRPHSAAARGMNARGVGVRQRPAIPRGAVQSGQKATSSNSRYEAMRISVDLDPHWQDE